MFVLKHPMLGIQEEKLATITRSGQALISLTAVA